MLQFFELSEFFLNSIDSIGSFLLYKPFDGFSQAVRMLWLGTGTAMPDFVYDILGSIDTMPVGFLIFGAGLATILTIKFISFLTDLFT